MEMKTQNQRLLTLSAVFNDTYYLLTSFTKKVLSEVQVEGLWP